MLISINVELKLCEIAVCKVIVPLQTSASRLKFSSFSCTLFLCCFVIAVWAQVVCISMTSHAESLGLISSPHCFAIFINDLKPAHFRHLNTVGTMTSITGVR